MYQIEEIIDTIHCGDCMPFMAGLPDKSIDMILCDLPYGMTACEWDKRIPFEPLWLAYKRIIKDKGAIALTTSQPFTSMLVMSNLEMFKYEWIWVKQPSNFLNLKYMPMREHENVLVFSKNGINFNPIKQPRAASSQIRDRYPGRIRQRNSIVEHYNIKAQAGQIAALRHPASVQIFSRETLAKLSPTQKPVALFEYLIRTYTNEGDIVLDNCIGSGTTAVACIKTGRHYIGCDMSQEYCNIAEERIKAEKSQLTMALNSSLNMEN